MIACQLRLGAVAAPLRASRQGAIRTFTSASILQREIRDAYILSASRTPTAKVRSGDQEVCSQRPGRLTRFSSMAPTRTCQRLNSVPWPSNRLLRSQEFPSRR
jgi:hypothetical protein